MSRSIHIQIKRHTLPPFDTGIVIDASGSRRKDSRFKRRWIVISSGYYGYLRTCPSPKPHVADNVLFFQLQSGHTSARMFNAILGLFRVILLVLAGSEQIALENLALKQQMAIFQRTVRRPKIRSMDRLFWICLRKMWKDWKSALVIVRPETVLHWHRKRFKHYWSQLSRHKSPGRPRTNGDIRKLVKTLAEANLGWDAPRIHGELLKLGIEISERTVSRLMPKRSPAPSQTWRTFLDNHVRDLVSIDFFTVPTAKLRVLFVFIVLSHERRRPNIRPQLGRHSK